MKINLWWRRVFHRVRTFGPMVFVRYGGTSIHLRLPGVIPRNAEGRRILNCLLSTDRWLWDGVTIRVFSGSTPCR